MATTDLSATYDRNSEVFWDKYRVLDCKPGRSIHMPLNYRSGVKSNQHAYDAMRYALEGVWNKWPAKDDSFLTRIKKGISKMFGKERRIAMLKKIESLEKDVAYYQERYRKLERFAEGLKEEVERLTPAPEPNTYELTYVTPDGTRRVETVKAHSFEDYGDFHVFRDHKDNVVAKFSNENLRSVEEK